MFDLNGNDFQENSIFNNGKAGLVENVEISVEKKVDGSNTPDYKLIAKDNLGTINVGFYYVTPNPQKSQEDNEKFEKQQVSRVVHAGRAVMGKDFAFPTVTSSKQAYDVIFDLIAKNATGKKFNIFTTYGTTQRPSKYLSFRYFSFIEPADVEVSTLVAKNGDLLERPVEDKPINDLDVLDSKATKEFIL